MSIGRNCYMLKLEIIDPEKSPNIKDFSERACFFTSRKSLPEEKVLYGIKITNLGFIGRVNGNIFKDKTIFNKNWMDPSDVKLSYFNNTKQAAENIKKAYKRF